jgi:hypothetical protein
MMAFPLWALVVSVYILIDNLRRSTDAVAIGES